MGSNGSWAKASQRSLRGHQALGLGADLPSMGAELLVADGESLPLGLAAGTVLLLAAFFLANSKEREDGAKEEELPPWANMVQVTQDVISGKPFDTVLLNMRQRHGDAFRIYVPSLFGEVIVLMGLQANQFVFTEQDKNLDQALGGVVGTAVYLVARRLWAQRSAKALSLERSLTKLLQTFLPTRKLLLGQHRSSSTQRKTSVTKWNKN